MCEVFRPGSNSVRDKTGMAMAVNDEGCTIMTRDWVLDDEDTTEGGQTKL